MVTSVPNKPQLTEAVLLKDVGASTVEWVQTQLVVAGYLTKDGVDGIVGDKTLGGLAAFKEDFYLKYPAAISPSTMDILGSVEGKHEVAD